jgi:hypothetical protein
MQVIGKNYVEILPQDVLKIDSVHSLNLLLQLFKSAPKISIVFDFPSLVKDKEKQKIANLTEDEYFSMIGKSFVLLCECVRAGKTVYVVLDESEQEQDVLDESNQKLIKTLNSMASVIIATYEPPSTTAILRAGILGK